MERVGQAVARELERFGPVAGLAPIVEAWPNAVGEVIARNAWPARLARDGTMHVHTQDSIWAFELTSRADEIRSRLGEQAPRRLAFAPGPLPEVTEERSERASRNISEPTSEQVARADSLTRVIRDDDLRKVVAKAVALSLANTAADRSFW